MKYQPVLDGRLFALIIAFGLLVRALIVVAGGGYVPPNDPTFYLTLAQHVRDGSGLWIDNDLYGPNFRALFPPLYPLLLSLFPVNGYSVAALNAAFDIGTAYLIYRLAGRNIIAPALFFLWPTVILNSVVAQKESLAMLVVAGLLYVRSARTFGLLGGLLTLAQPALLFFPLILSATKGWRYAGMAALFTALILSPWIIRNALVLGEFVPLTSGAGFSLAHVVNGGHVSPSPEILAMPEVERAAAVGWDALAAILSNPLAYLRQVASNAGNAILFDTFAIERLRLGISAPIQALHFLLLGAVAFTGKSARPILLVAGLTILTMLWFEFGERHRYFLYPIIAVLVARVRLITPVKTDNRPGGKVSRA